jgi:hypothetical protein
VEWINPLAESDRSIYQADYHCSYFILSPVRLMDRLQVIIESPDDYDYRHQEIIDRTFVDLCREFSDAVAIRRCESILKELRKLDREENGRRSAERVVPTLAGRVIKDVRRLLWRLEIKVRSRTIPDLRPGNVDDPHEAIARGTTSLQIGKTLERSWYMVFTIE